MTALQDRVKKYFLAAFSIFWKEEQGPITTWTYLGVGAIYICTSQPVLVVLHHKFCMEWEMRRNKKANGMRIKFHIGSLLSSLRSIWSEKAGRMKKEWYECQVPIESWRGETKSYNDFKELQSGLN